MNRNERLTADINTDRDCEMCGADWRGGPECHVCGYDAAADDDNYDGPAETDDWDGPIARSH